MREGYYELAYKAFLPYRPTSKEKLSILKRINKRCVYTISIGGK